MTEDETLGVLHVSHIANAFEAKRKRWLMYLTVALLVILFLGWAAYQFSGSYFYVFASLIAAIAAADYTRKLLKRSLSRDVMPILAKMVGDFEFKREGRKTDFLIQNGVLPSGHVARSEDSISGHVEDVTFASWEASIEAGNNKNRQTVFHGMIVEVDVEDPRWLLIRPQVNAVFEILRNLFKPVHEQGATMSNVSISGKSYELWTRELEWVEHDLCEKIDALNAGLPSDAGFRGVFQAHQRAYVLLDVRRDLYNLGGLLSSKKKVSQHIDQALADLSIPATCAVHWSLVSKTPSRDGL